jgi:hypothetical protein
MYLQIPEIPVRLIDFVNRQPPNSEIAAQWVVVHSYLYRIEYALTKGQAIRNFNRVQ